MADKKINIVLNIGAEIKDLQSKIPQLQQQLNKVKLTGLSGQNLTTDFENIQKRFKKLQEQAGQPFTAKADFSKMEKEVASVQSAIKSFTKELLQLQNSTDKKKLGLLPDDQKQKIDKVKKALDSYAESTSRTIKKTEELRKAEQSLQKIQQKADQANAKTPKSQEWQSLKQGELKTLQKELKQAETVRRATAEAYSKKGWVQTETGKKYQAGEKVDVDVGGQKAQTSLKETTEQVIKLQNKIKELKTELNNSITQPELTQVNQELENQKTLVNNLTSSWSQLSLKDKEEAFTALKNVAQQVGVSLEGINNSGDFEKLENRLKQLKTNGIQQVDSALEDLLQQTKSMSPSLNQMGKEVQKTGDSFDLAAAKAQEFSSLKNRVLSFFSITGAIQIFRRAIRSAFETVKDLDAAMTEIAVVSKFSVNDMWSQLPRFTDNANELGLSIKDVYDATTLYVQQGLDLDKSLELSTETLKMAAIAGLDAAAATDAMTSALRGFNMELNEDSARKVSDIYSKLAAITASDVEELSTAMSKTASIAHSVNMEFETTASFLAQGIETTREAAETIGTMLKTVIGRFSEVKSLYSEGQITGADEEGEAIDVNKVQTALRAAGVSMTDFLTGKEGLDQIFLRLAERWNDLDVLTQRYIATMAAGSRQQSRFIAIMQDYAKTTQLINAAYNSAGASQEQFEKTLDSLQAKLTRLKTAWNEFTMGLSNNEIIGGVVTALTEMLKAVNGLIDGLSGGSGLVKSVLSLGAAFVGIRAGGVILDKILKSDFAQRKFAAVRGDTSGIEENENRKKGGAFTRAFGSVKQLRTDYKNQAGDKRRRKQVIKDFFVGEEETQQKIQKSYIKETENISQSLASAKESMGGFITSEDTNNVDALVNSFRNGSISAEDFSKKLTEMGISEEQAAVHVANLQRANEQQAISVQNVGTAIAGVGAALSVLGLIFSQFGEEGEKVGKVISVIGTGLVTLGMLLPQLVIGIKAIDKTLTAFKASHPALFAITVALTAIIGLITAISAISNANSPEKKLEKATEAANDAKKAADEAAQSYQELADKKIALEELTTKMESLTKGTLEWKQALIESNNEILSLQQKYSNLQVETDKDGKLIIKNWNEILEKQYEASKLASYAANAATIKQIEAQLDVNNNNLSSSLSAQEKQTKKEQNKLSAAAQKKALIQSTVATATDNNEIAKSIGEILLKKTYYSSEENPVDLYTEAINKANKKIDDMSKKERNKKYDEIFGQGAAAELDDDGAVKERLKQIEQGVQLEEIGNAVAKLGESEQALVGALGGNIAQTIDKFTDEKGNITLGQNVDTQQIADALGLSKNAVDKMWAETEEEIKSKIDAFNNGPLKGLVGKTSYSNLVNLSEQIKTMSNETAKNYIDSYSKLIENSELEAAEKTQLENYLSSLDLSDPISEIDARDFMKNLGISEVEIEKFWANANAAVQPYITSLEQINALNQKISNLGEVRGLVENGETTFSSENKASLISAGFNEADFIKTGFDEWTYIGEDNNTLLEQIDEKVGLISNKIVGGLGEAIEQGERYGDVIENDSDLEKNLKLLAENGLSGTTFEPQDLANMASILDIDTSKLSPEGIANKLVEAYNLYTNIDQNKDAAKRERMNAASLQYELHGDFGDFTGNISNEEQIAIMEGQLRKNAGALELYNELKEKAGYESKEFNLKLANEAIQLTKLTKHYKVAAESIDDYKDILIQGESAGTDYFEAMNKAKGDLASLFQVDSSLITEEFIKQYAQDIYNLAEGGEVGTQAFQNLWEAIKQIKLDSMVEGLDFFIKDGEDVINDFSNWIEGLDPTIGIGTELSTEGLESGLVLLAQQAHNAGKDVQTALAPAIAMLEELTGTKINIQYEEEEFDSGGRYISAKSMEGLLAQGWRVGKGGKLVRTKAITAISASKAGSPYDKFVAPSVSSSGKSSTGGSSSEKKESTWENPYDKLYNLTEKINEALRQREKLEREYDRILERRGSTFQELRKNYNAQLQSLQKEIALQNQLRAGRLAQLNALSSETYKGQDSEGNELTKSFADWGVTKYGSYNPNTGLLQIDWNAIDRVKDENTGGAIEAYINRLEELQGQIEDIDSQIEDFQDKITELQKEGMQGYLDFEQKVYDAIVNQQQELIDSYQNLSDELTESNQRILNSIQDSIDLQRQIRDNTKTEDDLNEKEARLAYLRRDTSNANLLEIKQLEDELANSRQDYEDNLIDQQLERLSKQNDDAQTAREKQIELMQAQLDYSEKNGEFWDKTYELIMEGFSETGDYSMSSNLWNLLQKDEGWKGMSKFGQLNWQEEISKAILAASHGYANWNMYKAKEIDKSLTTGDGRQLTYDGKQWKDSNGNIYSGVDYDSSIGQFIYSGMTPVKKLSPSGADRGSHGLVGIGSRVRVDSKTPIYSNSYGGGAGRQYYANDPIYNILDEKNGYYLVRHHKLSSGYTGWFKKSDVKAYKKGGLADFTGPAWLDGTKSSPELILNARDTENFIELKNILGALMKSGVTQTTSSSVGDMYFDIDINVDEISSDYDVEQLKKKIKQDITNDAMYRNVNLINLIR
jgi:TP901 family phage tail tape measure protein